MHGVCSFCHQSHRALWVVFQYPAGDGQMRAPRRGNGGDFDPAAPYRMYHGDRVPGFPQVRVRVAEPC